MSEMVTRLANVISRECRLMGDPIGSSAAGEAARAVLQSMYNPTEEMCEAAHIYGELSTTGARWCWQTMVEMALK